MSYKSLLFCPDEKAAIVVTQVLSELEFTVEIALEPFATVKKLTDEHFDALVVDCQNEQDASLLFKAARNSSHNHSSLAVAVVEGQAGVAKAFRIGANLVLTKPINVEQSKGTLRVARGLLRKNASASAAGSASRQSAAAPPASTQTATPPSAAKPAAHITEHNPLPSRPAALKPASSPAVVSPAPHLAAAATVPYSALETEKEPTPEPEAADLALLESLPEISGKPASESVESAFATQAEPIAASTARHAAAAAPAIDKKPVEIRSAGAAPMVTNEPIVKEISTPEIDVPITVPTFSSLGGTRSHESGSGGRFLKVAVVLLFAGAAGYFGWQKLHPLQYLHRAPAAVVEKPAAAPTASPSATPPVAATPQAALQTEASAPENAPANLAPETSVADAPAAPPTPHAVHNARPEDIQVQEMPISRDMKIPPSSKPQKQPLIVKPGAAPAASQPATPATPPPSLEIAASPSSSAALSGLVSTNIPLPKPAPGTVRVSQGVSQGLVLKKVPPEYPAMAVKMRKEGAVELLATVNKDGNITNVKVLSGDGILARAAVDAVQRWKYRPYLLNGEPVEIETQVSIVFKLPQ